MNQGLSILIPTYNDICTKQVERIVDLLKCHPNINYEVLVADDCSPNRQYIAVNSSIKKYALCQYIQLNKNKGRAAIRNFLAEIAQYDLLLYLDCGVIIDDDSFFDNYLRYTDSTTSVVCGGVKPQPPHGNASQSLRYIYEKKYCETHPASVRNATPYLSFRTTNFLIKKKVMQQIRIDEHFTGFGYEDVDFGRRLEKAHISILHIDNPVSYYEYENNETYLNKIEESLRTLHIHRKTLRHYSLLLTVLHHFRVVVPLIRLYHQLAKKWEKRKLTGTHPSLFILKLYKLGYLSSL